MKTDKQGGGMVIYIHKSLTLWLSDKDKEILTLKLQGKIFKKIILSCCFSLPSGNSKNVSRFLQKKIREKSLSEKISCVICDFNVNCLKFHKIAKIKHFHQKSFEVPSLL